MLQYLPNALTFSRLLLAGPLGYFILHQNYEWALATGALAGLTDALDGFLARRLGALSRLGAAVDPIADKVLITVAIADLDHAKAVARGDEAHGLGVDGERSVAGQNACGKVFFMEMHCHAARFRRRGD